MAGTKAHPRWLDERRRALAAEPASLQMAVTLAKRAACRCPWLYDDLLSAAHVGLCEAAIAFDPGRGVKFSTYAVPRIRGAIIDMQRDMMLLGYRRGKHREGAPYIGSIESGIYGDWDEGNHNVTIAETIASDDEPIGWEAEYQDELRGLSRLLADDVMLPGKAIEAVVVLYGRADGATQRAASVLVGVKPARFSQLHGAVRESARKRRAG